MTTRQPVPYAEAERKLNAVDDHLIELGHELTQSYIALATYGPYCHGDEPRAARARLERSIHDLLNAGIGLLSAVDTFLTERLAMMRSDGASASPDAQACGERRAIYARAAHAFSDLLHDLEWSNQVRSSAGVSGQWDRLWARLRVPCSPATAMSRPDRPGA